MSQVAMADDYPFEITNRRLGEGSFGEVYFGRNRLNRKPVAIKVLKEVTDVNGISHGFMREVALLKRLQKLPHPNVLGLFDVTQLAGDKFIMVMPMYNEDLGEFLIKIKTERAGDPMPEQRIKHLLRQILAGLDHLHSNAIMHRDLKPANILIHDTDQVAIADYGLARVLNTPGVQLTPVVQTMWYRAPEVLINRGYSLKADSFSVGLIMVELYRYETLLQGRNENEQLKHIVNLVGSPDLSLLPVALHQQFGGVPGTISTIPVPGMSDVARNLFVGLTKFDPDQRLSAQQALEDPFFSAAQSLPLVIFHAHHQQQRQQQQLLVSPPQAPPGLAAAPREQRQPRFVPVGDNDDVMIEIDSTSRDYTSS